MMRSKVLIVKDRLERVIASSLCSAEDASKYIVELRELADKMVDKRLIKRQSQLFKALSDPLRLKIRQLLTLREICACEIMAAFNLTQPTTSITLKSLNRPSWSSLDMKENGSASTLQICKYPRFLRILILKIR